MMFVTEMEAMREYVACLERENEAKSQEQALVYRELQALQYELAGMDRLYSVNRQLSDEIHRLNAVVVQKQGLVRQLMQASGCIEELRGEIVRMEGVVKSVQQNRSVLEELLDQERGANQHLRNEVGQLTGQVGSLRASLQELELKNNELSVSLEKMREETQQYEQRMKEHWVEEERLQSLASNYMRVETALIEKEEYADDLSHEIVQLRNYCVALKQELNNKQSQIVGLSAQLQAARQQSHHNESIPALLDSFSKIDLIKQSNALVERVNSLQRQNRGECDVLLAGKGKGEDKLMMRLRGLQVKFDSLVESLTV